MVDNPTNPIEGIPTDRRSHWERYGWEAIKADLINGGFRLVGGPPEVRDQAWLWVRYMEEKSKAPHVSRIVVAEKTENREAMGVPFGLLHAQVWSKCETLFITGHYGQAVEMSFRVVRDRLRELTKYEKGQDAFGIGKGDLYVHGAVTEHAEEDFNEGVKFLTMAIDRFRNEKTHTAEVGITDAVRAFQYLSLSSLAMRLLEKAEVNSELRARAKQRAGR